MKRTKHAASSPQAEDTSRPRNRRQALALGGAAAAAAAVAALGVDRGKKAHATTPGNALILAEPNSTGNVGTELRGDVDPGAVLNIESLGDGEALHAESSGESATIAAHAQSGLGVNASTRGPDGAVLGTALLPGQDPHAPAQGPADGVRGISGTGPGVRGDSQSGPGVRGDSQSGRGVAGEGYTGVWGASSFISDGGSASGVVEDGKGRPPAGVLGEAWQDAFAGVVAWSGGGGPLALAVIGKAAFTTAGAGIVASNASAAEVPESAVTAESHITVTLMGNPGQARVVWVERKPGTGFVVHTTSDLSGGRPAAGGGGGAVGGQPAEQQSRSGWDVPFTYLIVEPVA